MSEGFLFFIARCPAEGARQNQVSSPPRNKCGINPHGCPAEGNPLKNKKLYWMPAFAGMTYNLMTSNERIAVQPTVTHDDRCVVSVTDKTKTVSFPRKRESSISLGTSPCDNSHFLDGALFCCQLRGGRLRVPILF